MAADTNYSNVALLLPFFGADGGTTFTDWSPTPKTITFDGQCHTETDQSKYYGSSLALDGNGDYLASTNSAYNLYNQIFTLEVWVYPTAASTHRGIAAYNFSGSNWFLYLHTGTTPAFIYGPGGVVISGGSAPLNQWTHIAVCYDGTTLRLFVNGVVKASVNSAVTVANGTAWLVIGQSGYGSGYQYWFAGYMQDLRLTKGVARYVADFTPPDKFIKTISGVIYDANGDPAERKIIFIIRDIFPPSASTIFTTTSSAADGTYALVMPDRGELIRIVLADETTLYNDIVDRVLPG